jgi:hypothetical protein
MKQLLMVLSVATITTVGAFGTIYTSFTLNNGQTVQLNTLTTLGPADVGGHLAGKCVLTDTSVTPVPRVSNVDIDTGSVFLYIGIILPGNARGPCHVLVYSNAGTWLPPTFLH